jgi:hypothetical protein
MTGRAPKEPLPVLKEEVSDSSSNSSSEGKGGSGSKKFSSKEKRLPQNFAERVLELEMQIERDCSNVEMINQLLYLYSVSLDLLTDVDSKQWSITMG